MRALHRAQPEWTPHCRLRSYKNTLLLSQPKCWLLTTTTEERVFCCGLWNTNNRSQNRNTGYSCSYQGLWTTYEKALISAKLQLTWKINCVSLFFFFFNCWEATKFKSPRDCNQQWKDVNGWNHKALDRLKKWNSTVWYPSNLTFQTNKPPESQVLHKRASLSL